MRQLASVQNQLNALNDPTIGLAALHGEITQTRIKIQEVVLTGVTGLREENREVRRRQDRMINDLHDTRGELRQLLDLASTLRTLTVPSVHGQEKADGPPEEGPETVPAQPADAPSAPAGRRTGPDSAAADSRQHAETETEPQAQRETVDPTEQQPQPVRTDNDQDLGLKKAIEAAYHGADISAASSPAVPHAPEIQSENTEVRHGVLLLRAAGVASVEVVAHRDSWEWLSGLATDHGHFHTPPAVEDIKDGRVQTVLSGRSLIALLIELWNTRSTAAPLGADWALATTSYHRITAELADVTGQGDTIRIVLDDGLPHTTDG
ncbi:hypothetical protein OG462_44680 [Streptomyces sp. NBC_01077]|uniref:hypothetical protein n=1 Tax=Streptomyces sp. NBC_01077 TaxID=2903746 RepID=UPI00386CDF4F|nr:hypothetical protein OG462_00325 [Streptomyces sp. NBC_01077]WSV43782.1 hypothetical protein OG462_44680 [Streptomyces sp. NBC_01077]